MLKSQRLQLGLKSKPSTLSSSKIAEVGLSNSGVTEDSQVLDKMRWTFALSFLILFFLG